MRHPGTADEVWRPAFGQFCYVIEIKGSPDLANSLLVGKCLKQKEIYCALIEVLSDLR